MFTIVFYLAFVFVGGCLGLAIVGAKLEDLVANRRPPFDEDN